MRQLVIVVDMVKGFLVSGNLADPKIRKIEHNIIELLKNKDNIFVCDKHSKNAKEFESYPIHCLENSEEIEIIDTLKPYTQKIIYKNSTNGFFQLDSTLYESYDEIYICGCCSDICVLQLALTIKAYCNEYNLNTKIIVDTTTIDTFDSPFHNRDKYHEMAIDLMRNAGIIIRNGE